MSPERKETDPNKPVKVTLDAARRFCEWMGSQHGMNLQLPTADQLKAAIEEEEVELVVKEWTREGYIFDPETGEADEDPGKDATASFRIVEEFDK